MKTIFITVSMVLLTGLSFGQSTNTKTNSDTSKTTTRVLTIQKKKLVKVNGSGLLQKSSAPVNNSNVQKANTTGNKEEENTPK